MNNVESHIRAPLLVVAVVLDERVQEHCGCESIIHTCRQQILRHAAFGQANAVVRVLKRCCQLVIEAEGPSPEIRMFVSGVKPACRKSAVCRQAAARVGTSENEIVIKSVLAVQSPFHCDSSAG